MKSLFSAKGITALLGAGRGRDCTPRPGSNQTIKAIQGLSDHQLRDLGLQRDQLAAARPKRQSGGAGR